MSEVVIRPYEARDRAAVRQICCDTADSGQPLERFFSDREVVADLVTRYYTDIEPRYSWVAEENGRVVGYLNGCLDTGRAIRAMVWRIGPAVVVKALFRGTFWQPKTRALARLNWREWLGSLLQKSGVSAADYPAHLHINLHESTRGHGVGPKLVERFFEQVRRAGISGVHVAVSGANVGGQKFFQSLGFVELGRRGRFRHPLTPEQLTQTIIYGKKL